MARVLGCERLPGVELSSAQVHRFPASGIAELGDAGRGAWRRRWTAATCTRCSRSSRSRSSRSARRKCSRRVRPIKQAPLIDYQHPHDLFMDLGVSYSRPVGPRTILADVLVVGSPALGPPAFMHRPSAADNPTAPLGHHEMDATHISHGVVTGGVRQGEFTLEGSWFRGAEPDENRKDIELGPLDSYSGRLSWRREAWDAQVSAAHLTTPEYVEPFSDVTRLTASIGYTRSGRPRGRAPRVGTEPRDSRQSGRLPVRGDRPIARAPVLVHAARADDERHPQRWRTPSARRRALPRALACRRLHRRLRLRHRGITRRAVRDGR